jgi:hypothetical protein
VLVGLLEQMRKENLDVGISLEFRDDLLTGQPKTELSDGGNLIKDDQD